MSRHRDAIDDVRMHRNLLALLPYCVHVRTVVVPPPALSAIVRYQPRRGGPSRHLGWS